MIAQDTNNPVLFFDGVCNLCNRSIAFIIRHDKKKTLRFASLQSEAGKAACAQFANKVPDSLVLFFQGKYYIKSDAALTTARLMGGVIACFFVFIIIPRFIRDSVYDFISRNRYRWFGRTDVCVLDAKRDAMKDRIAG